MGQATSPSTGIRDGLARGYRVWGIARSPVYWQRQEPRAAGRRPSPLGPCTDKELVGQIRRVLHASPFHGEGYRKVWARLRYASVHTSPRRVLRLMREYGLLAPQRQGQPHGAKAHDGTLTPNRIKTLWGTDMTATFTREDGQVAIFIAVEHCSAECIGMHAAKHGPRFEALEPIRQGVRTHVGSFGKKVAHGVTLRHDHGSQSMSGVFQDELRCLGLTSSPALVREPQGNGCAERFIRTLKENLRWLTTFKTVEELRVALLEFQHRYNEAWLIGRHSDKTPTQVLQEQLAALAQHVAGF
jgi:putative transposase